MNLHESSIVESKCLIVDDEPLARDVLKRYMEKIPVLNLVGEFSNAIDAFVFLQSNDVDILFLDIRMPELLGTELVRAMKNPPKVIFTTAYKEYALDGFELDAIDYLLKPIRFDRFLKAVNKALPSNQSLVDHPELNLIDRKAGTDSIYLKIDRKQVRIILADIHYIESDKDYVKIYTAQKMYLCRQTISAIEIMLNKGEFIRIHRSFIVPIAQIKSYTHEVVEINKKELPIGKFYLNSFLQTIG